MTDGKGLITLITTSQCVYGVARSSQCAMASVGLHSEWRLYHYLCDPVGCSTTVMPYGV
jgi:hypothetical protein